MNQPEKQTPPTVADIMRRVNDMEQRRTLIRAQIDRPPANAGQYYFLDREQEVRSLTLMIDAIIDLIK